MTPINRLRLIGSFMQTTWLPKFTSRLEFESWQAKRINIFLRTQLKNSSFYRDFVGHPLDQLPIVDKSVMLKNFTAMNVEGISLDAATNIAFKNEANRDFALKLDGITVGLSSGTSGSRGVFLTTEKENAKWAGIVIARALPCFFLPQLLRGSKPIRIAFFLRANSDLYMALQSKRIDFRFFDLFVGVEAHLDDLETYNPDFLVAPAHVLSAIASAALVGRLRIKPQRVISVAEVLEVDDKARIEKAFCVMVHQLYQCTEGFLGYTCEHGVMHLNEEYVHVEPEWLDKEKTRFIPIITDFTRTTQHVIRYRLNDVLRVRQAPCACGRVSRALDAIEGRCDDVLWFASKASGEYCPLYPDMLRHALTSAAAVIPDYRIEQNADTLCIAVADQTPQSLCEVEMAIRTLLSRHGLKAPIFKVIPFSANESIAKRRRIVCNQRPANILALAATKPSNARH